MGLVVTISLDGEILHQWHPIRCEIGPRKKDTDQIIPMTLYFHKDSVSVLGKLNEKVFGQVVDNRDTPYVFRERVKIIKGFFRGQQGICQQYDEEVGKVLVHISNSAERAFLALDHIEKMPQEEAQCKEQEREDAP